MYFTVCLQLVKVSAVLYFLKETCKSRIQSPKKIGTCLKSAQLSILHKFAIRLPFPVFTVLQANLQFVPVRS